VKLVCGAHPIGGKINRIFGVKYTSIKGTGKNWAKHLHSTKGGNEVSVGSSCSTAQVGFQHKKTSTIGVQNPVQKEETKHYRTAPVEARGGSLET